MKKRAWFFLLLFVFSFPAFAGQTPDSLTVGNFSKGPQKKGLPENWKHLTFRGVKPTEYTLVQESGTWVVQAVSESSASGFITRVEINPTDYPVIEWQWKVKNLLEKSNLKTKKGDDHPARLYVGFEYDRSQFNWRERFFYWVVRLFYGKDYPARSLNYIWASHAEEGSMARNPYTSWVKTIVVKSGDENLGQWVSESRNVVEDYQKAFGTEAPMISGIGLMTDSDGTKERATAYFGDILFKKFTASLGDLNE